MIINRQRCLLKTCQFVRLICTEGCPTVSLGSELSKTVKKCDSKSPTHKTKSKKKSTKKSSEMGESNTHIFTSSSEDCLLKVESQTVSNVHEGSTTPSQDEAIAPPALDETKRKEQAPSEAVRKGCNVKMESFLIRNMMTFPLHVSVESAAESDESKISPSSFPSVSAVLQETTSVESRRALEEWKCRMIAQMGEAKFFSMQKATLVRGSKFHNSLKQYLMGEDLDKVSVDKEVEGCWNSVQTILPKISDVITVESGLFHPHLHYKGIVDCVASYNNVPHVIEWKQSEKTKKGLSSTYDAPVQVCAYMGALSWCKKANVAAPVSNGLVVIAYTDGSPADAFPMDSEHCESYWQQWLRRLQRFWLNRSPNLQAEAG